MNQSLLRAIVVSTTMIVLLFLTAFASAHQEKAVGAAGQTPVSGVRR